MRSVGALGALTAVALLLTTAHPPQASTGAPKQSGALGPGSRHFYFSNSPECTPQSVWRMAVLTFGKSSNGAQLKVTAETMHRQKVNVRSFQGLVRDATQCQVVVDVYAYYRPLWSWNGAREFLNEESDWLEQYDIVAVQYPHLTNQRRDFAGLAGGRWQEYPIPVYQDGRAVAFPSAGGVLMLHETLHTWTGWLEATGADLELPPGGVHGFAPPYRSEQVFLTDYLAGRVLHKGRSTGLGARTLVISGTPTQGMRHANEDRSLVDSQGLQTNLDD